MGSTSNHVPETQFIIDEAIRNELILHLIFQQLPIGELKVCRLVCSKWNPLALREIQAKNWNDSTTFTPTFKDDKQEYFEAYMNVFRDSPENFPYSCHTFGTNSSIRLQPINRELEREFCVTFRKQIKGIHLCHAMETSMYAQDILEICGESLVELGISSTPYRTLAQREINESSQNRLLLPNLKCISVDASDSRPNDGTENYLLWSDRIFKNILSNMRPNALEELNYHNWGRFESTVKHLIEFNQINSLRKLSLYPNSYVQKGDLLIFKKKGINLQLNQLRVHNENPTSSQRQLWEKRVFDIEPDELYQFLDTQKNSLEHLNLMCSTYSFPSNMTRVQKMKLFINRAGLDLNSRTINFAESFPNIKELCLSISWMDSRWSRDEHKNYQILSEQEQCTSLRKLTLPVILYLSAGDMNRTLKIFPKLSYLELYAFSSEIFLAIWNSVELADSLNVLILRIAGVVKGGPVYKTNALKLDQIFSGVSQQEILSVTIEKYSEEFNLNEFQDNSILRLKNLRKLHVYWQESPTYQLQLLTDFVVICVFDKMENLSDLFIHQNIHRFSHGCAARLPTNTGTKECLHYNYKRHSEEYLKTRMSKSELHLHA